MAIFYGSTSGTWRIVKNGASRGEGLAEAAYLGVLEDLQAVPKDALWSLRGIKSHLRYTGADERKQLEEKQEGLGRPQATLAAMLPIRKNAAWWKLAQDERRKIFEEQSHHIKDSLKYLPAIARQLYHSRDLGEPFDFITWFEFAPGDEGAFDELLGMLRKTEEWDYVEREC